MMTPQVWVRHGHAVYLGPAPRADVHSTSIAQLVVGVEGPVTLRADGLSDRTTRSIVIPARVAHQICSGGEQVLLCYFDPTSTQWARCLGGMRRRHGPFGIDHRHEDVLIAASRRESLDVDEVLKLASIPATSGSDRRIALVAARIRADPAHSYRADTLAAEAGISTSYFLRMFAEQTGTSLRRYLQWARILHAANVIAHGGDFTRAAAEAGFSSPSHFSVVFRRMFGLAPSALLEPGMRIWIEDGADPLR